MLHLPTDLRGATVLDIGTSDGFFALSLAGRGARVTCVDYRRKDLHGFAAMEQITGLSFDYRQCNVYGLDARELGQFDIVLFLGVLYHLPDMLAALRIVHSLAKTTMFLETHSEEFGSELALARYCVGDSLNNDNTNFWAPNRRCVSDMLVDVGFEIVREVPTNERLFVEARTGAEQYKTTLAYAVTS